MSEGLSRAEPKNLETDSGLKARQVIFNDVSITERLENQIPPEEFDEYKKRFSIFKDMVESAEDPSERKFLSSRMVFSTVMGLEAESSFFPNEGKVLYKALERSKAKDDFVCFVGGRYESSVSFVNLQAAERILRERSDLLGISLPERDLTKDEISQYVMDLYNQSDPKAANMAIGILSGFPPLAVNYWVNKNDSDQLSRSQWFLRPLRREERSFLSSSREIELDQDRVEKVYSRKYVDFGKRKVDYEAEEVGITGFGTGFVSPYPLPDQVIEHCQKLLEIDRRLSVLDYVQSIKGSIEHTISTSSD